MNVTECLLKITELTQQNLDILSAINESFFAKNTAVQTSVAGTRYIIPSFISLENKVNHLQDAFDNLVHAAQCGEAWLNYDGNTKDIVVQQYQQAPNPLSLIPVTTFSSETVDMFKDMLSPTPFINFTLNDLPDNINQINVKKIVVYNEELLVKVQGLVDVSNQQVDGNGEIISAGISYGELMQVIQDGGYVEDVDFADYDTVYDIKPRKSLGYGVYELVEVVGDRINNDLEEIITVTIQCEENSDGTYKFPTFTGTDGVTEYELEDGYILSTYDGCALLEIVEGCSEKQSTLTESTVKLKLQVLHGAYLALQPGNGDYGKLKFYSISQKEIIEQDKNLHLPLEEDQYICIFTAPLNSRVRVQSVWGTGLYINVYKLVMDTSGNESTSGTGTSSGTDGESFEDYYAENVSNIGDILTELTEIMSPSITQFSQDEFKTLTQTQPDLDQTTNKTLDVVQINKHLDDSETVKTIRSLYAQKQQLNSELTEVQTKISNLNSELSQISFDDLSGTRSMYEAQLTDLKARQNELVTSITKICDAIAQSANNSTIPLENAKFRIRGYVDVQEFIDVVNKKDTDDDTSEEEAKKLIDLGDVIGVQLRYRYKNPDTPQANVSVVNEFLFTEWVEQNPTVRKRKMSYSNGQYNLQWTDTVTDANGNEVLNESDNVPKFNQVDIPITQGESVDIQARILYIFGYPFVEVTSEWSDIENVEFPEELIQDVQVLTIIEENNNDIETNRFENILRSYGVIEHVEDNIVDQDITYFHKPESIASGFYTDERRIIPLRDKLTEMNNSLTEIEDLIKGTTSEAIEVSVVLDNQIYVLEPDIDNQIQLTPYSSVSVGSVASGTAFRNKSYGPVQMTGSIKITNTTDHTVYLYSVFPGPRTTNVPDIRASRRRFTLTDYYNFGADKIIITD